MARLRILGDEDVRAAIDTDRALELARKTLQDQAAGRSLLSTPAAMTLDSETLGGPRFRFKAATVGHLNASGIGLSLRRTKTGTPTRNYCAIYDHDGSTITGLVSGVWLGAVRTAAFGMVSVEKLLPARPLVVGLYGAGRIAAEMVPVLARTLNVAELRVHSRRPESMASFVSRHAPTVSFALRAEPDRARMPEDADLLITLTESPDPLIVPGRLKPGVVICSMGSYNELAYGVLEQAERLIVDDAEFAAEIGDGGAWIAQGHLSREDFVRRVDALGWEVVSGRKPGRLAATDRIVALIQGMAIGDVAFAAWALQEAARLGRGTTVELP